MLILRMVEKGKSVARRVARGENLIECGDNKVEMRFPSITNCSPLAFEVRSSYFIVYI